MISTYIYFSNLLLQNILEYIDYMDSCFAECFAIEYDGIAWTDANEFMKYQYNGIIEPVLMINARGPHNSVYFGKHTFCIGIEFPYHYIGLPLNNLSPEQKEETDKKWQKFLKKVFSKLPITIMYLTEGDFSTGDTDNLLSRNSINSVHAIYYPEKGEMKTIE